MSNPAEKRGLEADYDGASLSFPYRKLGPNICCPRLALLAAILKR
jgi:hypothetical protein